MKTFAVLVQIIIRNRPAIVRRVVSARDESSAMNLAPALIGGNGKALSALRLN